MATYFDAIMRTEGNIFKEWEEGEEMSTEDAKKVIADVLDEYEGFCEVISTPDKSWTMYYDEMNHIPVCAVKWF